MILVEDCYAYYFYAYYWNSLSVLKKQLNSVSEVYFTFCYAYHIHPWIFSSAIAINRSSLTFDLILISLPSWGVMIAQLGETRKKACISTYFIESKLRDRLDQQLLEQIESLSFHCQILLDLREWSKKTSYHLESTLWFSTLTQIYSYRPELYKTLFGRNSYLSPVYHHPINKFLNILCKTTLMPI